MENKEKIVFCYELEIDEENDTKVDYIALVYNPAIKLNYVAFSENGETNKAKQKHFDFKIQDSAKRMLTGVFMRANLPIERYDEDTDEKYFVKFTSQSIEKGRNKFFKNKFNSNINEEHTDKMCGAYVVDSWIIRDVNSNPLKGYGFNDVEVGDWVGTVFVESEEYWNEYVTTGKLR